MNKNLLRRSHRRLVEKLHSFLYAKVWNRFFAIVRYNIDRFVLVSISRTSILEHRNVNLRFASILEKSILDERKYISVISSVTDPRIAIRSVEYESLQSVLRFNRTIVFSKCTGETVRYNITRFVLVLIYPSINAPVRGKFVRSRLFQMSNESLFRRFDRRVKHQSRASVE